MSFTSQPCPPLGSPLRSPSCSCCTITKDPQAVKEAPCLASDPLDAQQPSDLASENCNFSFFAPVVASPSPLQLLLVSCSGGGQVFDQAVDILGSLPPGSEYPSAQWRKGKKFCLYWSNSVSLDAAILPVNPPGMLTILIGQGGCSPVNSLDGGTRILLVASWAAGYNLQFS